MQSFSKLILAILVLALMADFGLATRTASFDLSDLRTLQCLNYEPETVNLKGQIVRGVFVNASERKETVWLLKLDKAICVNAASGDDINVKAESVRRVQLVLTAEQYREFKKYLNKRVAASGTLFHSHTQHHFTDVLLTVSEIKSYDRK